MQENASVTAVTPITSAKDIKVPDIKEFLKSGVQFGHETTRWNPKMKPYIFGVKNNIHVIDLQQTMPKLAEAAAFLTEAAKKGPVLFVASKRQARDIVREYALDSGSYFVCYRWLGGLLTNFKMIKHSLQKLSQIEEEFEKGVSNRTKFEVNKMKKEWERMNRIYCGIKSMERYPEAIVIVDCHYEKGAVEEAKAAGVPIVAMVDTNCDPDMIDYVIPANDDAIKSITLIMGVLNDAVKKGNPGKWVKHVTKDYSDYEVQVIKEHKESPAEESAEVAPVIEEKQQAVKTRRHEQAKGIMEIVKEQAQKDSAANVKQEKAAEQKSKPVKKETKVVVKAAKAAKPAKKQTKK